MDVPARVPSANVPRRSALRRIRLVGLHLARLALLATVLWLIRDRHVWLVAQRHGREGPPISLDQVRGFFPNAVSLGDWDAATGGRIVEDADRKALGYVLQTSPLCDTIVGYSGPTNTLIALDLNDRVLGIRVLESRDTAEHVQMVLGDTQFLTWFNGRARREVRALESVDGVSGATLTSLAIAQGVVRRLGGGQPSFRFPQPLRVAEVRPFLPAAASLVPVPGRPAVLRILDRDERGIGIVTRTAPTADDLVGYAGPIDTLVVLDARNRVQGIAIRSHYETEEYVGWVRDDEYFMTLFHDMTLQELADLDVRAARIEGVSGATMTSVTIAEGLALAARKALEERSVSEAPSISLTSRDWGALAFLAMAAIVGLTRLRAWKPLRVILQLSLIVYLGLINGDMVSQTVLVGWTQHAVPWQTAFGLVCLTAAALIVPVLTKRQLYCHHLCPHGAVQQLFHRRLPWRVHLPHRLTMCLKLIPVGLLLLVLAVALRELPVDLASIEPFDAYLVGVAGGATFLVALVGLVASLFIPMAYCRFGCPTGAVLNFLRRNARSDRISCRDMAAIVLLMAAIALRCL